MVLLALWIIGGQVVLYLAGLQDVPQELYDAAAVLITLPVIIVFFLTQRTFVQGVTLTGIKG